MGTYKVGQQIEVPLERLTGRTGNYRRADEKGLETLAESMAALGQIDPIHVYLKNGRLEVSDGFRRLEARQRYAQKYGWKDIRAEVVPASTAPVIRLAANLVRQDASSFETADYLWKLSKEGWRPRELSGAVGLNLRSVQTLLKFRRDLSPQVIAAWQQDRDRRLTWARLRELLATDEANLNQRLAAMLVPAKREVPDDDDENEDALDGGEGEPKPKRAPTIRKMGRTRAAKLVARLGEIGEAKVRDDYRAGPVYQLLRVFAGLEPATAADALVEQLRADFGVEAKDAA